MKSAMMGIALACVAASACAEELTIDALKAQGGKRLQEVAIRSLLVGHAIDEGTPPETKTLTPESDGTLFGATGARVEGKGKMGKQGKTHQGTWRIENDRFCVDIDFGRGAEKWCGGVWQSGDKHYFTHAVRGQPAVIPFTVR